jgi:hypothetical protein
MPEDKKLLLSDLKVQSFVTELNKEKENKIKGGCYKTMHISGCYTADPTVVYLCPCAIPIGRTEDC